MGSVLSSLSTPFVYSNANCKPSAIMPKVGNGQYETGCVDIMISRAEGEPEKGGVFARIFYPTQLASSNDGENKENEPQKAFTKEDYPLWRPRKEYLDGLADYREASPTYMHFFFDWIMPERRISASWQSPLFIGSNKGEQVKFPVAVFSHGISGQRLCYSTFCSSLASYGYVVAALEHRDTSASWTFYLERDLSTGELVEKGIGIDKFPAGEHEFRRRNSQLHERVTECKKALEMFEALNSGEYYSMSKNEPMKTMGGKRKEIVFGQEFDWTQFKGRLDTSKSIAVGHSLGGATAIAAAAIHPEFKVCIVLDGWLYPLEWELYERIRQKTTCLMLNASKWQWASNVKKMMELDSNNGKSRIMFTFKDIVHQSFSDFSYLMPGFVGRKFNLEGELSPIYTGGAILEMIVAFIRHCFDQPKDGFEGVKEVANKYAHFVMAGTDIDGLNPKKELVNEEEKERKGSGVEINSQL